MHMVPGTLMGSTGISPEIFAAIVEPVLLVLAAVGFGALVTIVIAITTHLGRTTGIDEAPTPRRRSAGGQPLAA